MSNSSYNSLYLNKTHTFTNKKNVTSFHGKKNIFSIYEQVLASNNLYSMVNGKIVDAFFPENTSLFSEAINNGFLKAREIVETTEVTRNYSSSLDTKQYQYKFFPKNWDENIFFDYLIFDNKVAIIREVNNELEGILVHDSKVYDIALIVFNRIWNVLPKS